MSCTLTVDIFLSVDGWAGSDSLPADDVSPDRGRRRARAGFADMASADLELVDQQVLDDRILLAEYRPTGKDIPRA